MNLFTWYTWYEYLVQCNLYILLCIRLTSAVLPYSVQFTLLHWEALCPNSAVYRRGNCSLIPDIGCLQPKSKIRYIQEFYLPHQAKMEFFLEFCFLYQTLCSQKVKYFIQTKLFFQRHFFKSKLGPQQKQMFLH